MAAAARVARIELEALLRARKLDNTLTSALPAPGLLDEQAVVPTGIAALDERLHGGVPRGQVSEVTGPRSSGRTSLLFSLLAGATARGELAALIDTLDMFDAVSAAACGIGMGRLLWVRGQGPVVSGRWSVTSGQRDTRNQLATDHRPLAPAHGLEAVVDRAVKALNLVLQAGGFGLVALDLAEVPAVLVRRLPFTTWLRLQKIVEGSGTACVLLGAAPIARSAGGVTIALQRSGQRSVVSGQWSVAGGQIDHRPLATGHRHARVFPGLDVEARISRARWPETAPCRFQISGSAQFSVHGSQDVTRDGLRTGN